MTAPDRIAAEWTADPVVPDAEGEFLRARLAWQTVGPASGELPQERTPLQCMVYARMTTSLFQYEMAIRRREARDCGL